MLDNAVGQQCWTTRSIERQINLALSDHVEVCGAVRVYNKLMSVESVRTFWSQVHRFICVVLVRGFQCKCELQLFCINIEIEWQTSEMTKLPSQEVQTDRHETEVASYQTQSVILSIMYFKHSLIFYSLGFRDFFCRLFTAFLNLVYPLYILSNF